MALNVKQEAFCLHYAKTGNATESYKQAGYKVKTERSAYAASNQLLKNIKVQERLKELADEIASSKIASIKEIQERLTSIMRMEQQEEVVMTKGTGEGCSEIKHVSKAPSLKDVIKAAETLAKMQGGFDNKINVEIAVPVFGGEDGLED